MNHQQRKILRFPSSPTAKTRRRRLFASSFPPSSPLIFRRRSHHFVDDFRIPPLIFIDAPTTSPPILQIPLPSSSTFPSPAAIADCQQTADSLLLSVFPAHPSTPTASPLPATTLKEGSERYKSQPQLLLESFLLSIQPTPMLFIFKSSLPYTFI